MTTPQALQDTINNVEDLQSVVKTMKALAAVSIRQYERAIASLSEYSRAVEMGFQIVLKQRHFDGELPLAPSSTPERFSFQRLAVIIFGSDRGLCGQFNERVVARAMSRLEELNAASDALIAISGDRLIAPLENENREIHQQFTVPVSASGIVDVVGQILQAIEEWQTRQRVDGVILFYNEPSGGAAYQQREFQLLPIAPDWLREIERRPWPTNVIPTFNMAGEQLLSALVREYLFLYLYRATAASLASENASRLASMQSAEKNIQERLSDLVARYRRERQRSITSELLDVVSGFEALKGSSS